MRCFKTWNFVKQRFYDHLWSSKPSFPLFHFVSHFTSISHFFTPIQTDFSTRKFRKARPKLLQRSKLSLAMFLCLSLIFGSWKAVDKKSLRVLKKGMSLCVLCYLTFLLRILQETSNHVYMVMEVSIWIFYPNDLRSRKQRSQWCQCSCFSSFTPIAALHFDLNWKLRLGSVRGYA